MRSETRQRWPAREWWALAVAGVAVVVAGLALYGLLSLAAGQRVERALFLVSLAMLVVALVCAARGMTLREEAIAALRRTASEHLEVVRELRAGGRERPVRWRPGMLSRRGDDLPERPDEARERDEYEARTLREVIGPVDDAAATLDGIGAHGEAAEVRQRARAAERAAAPNLARHDDSRARGERLARRARRWLAVAAATGATSFSTAVATTAVEEVARTANFGRPLAVQVENDRGGEGGEGESCTQAAQQGVALGRADPALARRYAKDEAGLPALVGPEVQSRCGGDYTDLLSGR